MHANRVAVVVMLPALLLLVGCANKFNRQNFDMIQINVDERSDVQAILGKPTADFEDEWMYDDLDRHLSAVIYFHEDGRVAGKEWIDSKAATWEGQNPKTDPKPEGEVRERKTTVRQYDD